MSYSVSLFIEFFFRFKAALQMINEQGKRQQREMQLYSDVETLIPVTQVFYTELNISF
jgi:hypothetical protein